MDTYTAVLITSLLATLRAGMADGVTVQLTQGLLKGREATTVQGGRYVSFQGVPFAKPPVGDLRFQPPAPPSNWEGIREALTEGPPCVQFNLLVKQLIGSEDCLYLNVYTPKVPTSEDETTRFPVMVYLHGGGFAEGSGTALAHGPDFIVDSGVILVTPNYRLGVLGFLSTGDSVVPGNMGLKDQVASLRWVKNNIASFGGDPSNVTLAGVSAGASSIILHLMSPLSEGLFQRAIAMSGSPLNPWSFSESAKERSFQLGRALGISTNDSKTLTDFLKTISAEKFPLVMRQALSQEDKDRLFMFVFVPSVEPDVEGAFLTEHPSTLLKLGNYRTVPMIAGVANKEGKFLIKWADLADNPQKLQDLDQNFANIIGSDLRMAVPEKKIKDAQSIKHFYFADGPVCNNSINKLVDLLSDLYFVEGVDTVLRSFASKAQHPLYYYCFSYEGTLSPISIFTYNGVPGASHGEDGAYLFTMGDTMLNINPESDEHKIRKLIVSMWTNFIKTGSPNSVSTNAVDSLNWPEYNEDERLFLEINLNPAVKKDLESHRLAFWRRIFT